MPTDLTRPSVVVPVCEDGEGFLRLVSALAGGTLLPAEIAVIDSSPADHLWDQWLPVAKAAAGTAGIGWTAIRLEPGRFNHGWTRNLGIAVAGGEFVALFSQDAVPEPDCLERLVRRIIADKRLAGVYARQMPAADTSGPVRRRIEAHYPAGPLPEGALRYDNVAGVIRRAAWNEIPFPKAEIAEDLAWARAASAKGWAFAYEPSARVTHAHELDGRADFERNLKLHRYLARELSQRTVPSLAAAVSGFTGLLARREHTVPQAAGEVFGQYFGGLAGAIDRLMPDRRAVTP